MLARATQDDFSAGMWRSVARHLIDKRGAWTLRNWLLDDDGSPYKRGGSVYRSNAAFGARTSFVWDGILAAGQRTVFASPTGFAVLAADDATPISLGGSGLAGPARGSVLDGLLFIDGGTLYGGSRKAVDYSAGTVTVTSGSANVSGAGTLWVANVDAGMLLTDGTRVYVVTEVVSDTQLKLDKPWEGSTTPGMAYTLRRLVTAGSGNTVVSGALYVAAGDRIWAATGNVLSFSDGRDPTTGATRPHQVPLGNQHQFSDAGAILGLAPLRGGVLVFTAGGLWMVGNVAFDLLDPTGNPMQDVQLVSRELVLWGGNAGITGWSNALIVPTLNGVYLVDGVSAPQLVSSSIAGLYAEHVRAGYRPGGAAVYRGHLFLPILNGATLADMLVCRLDRPVSRTRLGTVFPWTQLAGAGAEVGQLHQRVEPNGGRPRLLAGTLGAAARVADLSLFFDPSDASKTDADGSAIAPVVEGRDVTTGDGNENHVRRLEVLYEMEGTGAQMRAWYSKGEAAADLPRWGTMTWGEDSWGDSSLGEYAPLPESGGESSGRDPHTWLFPRAARTRRIRSRLEVAGTAARVRLRSVTYHIRPARRGR